MANRYFDFNNPRDDNRRSYTINLRPIEYSTGWQVVVEAAGLIDGVEPFNEHMAGASNTMREFAVANKGQLIVGAPAHRLFGRGRHRLRRVFCFVEAHCTQYKQLLTLSAKNIFLPTHQLSSQYLLTSALYLAYYCKQLSSHKIWIVVCQLTRYWEQYATLLVHEYYFLATHDPLNCKILLPIESDSPPY